MKGWLAVAILVGIGSRADAFGPRKVDLPVAPGRAARTIDAKGPASAARRFASLPGWSATWDHDTGVPTWLWGELLAIGSTIDPAIAERTAREFLAAHVDVLAPGGRAADFTLVSNQLDGELRTVGFVQTANGLPVIGGQVGFVFAHDHLFAITSAALPNVQTQTSSRAGPATMRARAEAWLHAETRMAVTTRSIGNRAILPIVTSSSIAYHVVDVLDLEAIGEPGRWDVYVDADGSPLARRSKIQMATGTLVYNVGTRYATGTRASTPVPRANIVVDGSANTTAADGTFAWIGTGSATVAPGLTSSITRIVNQAGALATASLVAQPAQAVEWTLATDEAGDAQLSTFIYASQIKARDRIVNPSVAAWLDQQLAFYVNEGGSCNAYSTGDDVHFFRKNSQCENTGRLADVVYHEFGHSFHNHSIIQGVGAYDSQLSEGLADFNAANLTEDSGVGRGFFFDDVPLREIDPIGVERMWPADIDADPHITGEIVSGALWDLRKALIAQLGHPAGVAASDKVFAGILQRAMDIPSSYIAALVADDDDANLANGTPHGCAIEHAFSAHGLVPGATTISFGQHVIENFHVTLPITTPPTTTCARANVTSVTVTWNVRGGAASSFDLQPQGLSWAGSFPQIPDGSLIEYSMLVALDDGSTRLLPNNPADPKYQTYVGPARSLWCEPFNTDPHWTQHSNLIGDAWEWGKPGRFPQSGDPLLPYTGEYVFGTGILRDGAYRGNEDTYAETPAIDVSSYREVRLQYRRWLTVEDATYDHATIAVNGTELWTNAKSAAATLDHVDREWRFHDLDLTPYVASGTAQARWSLTSDSSKSLGGWTLDDVCIMGISKIGKCGDGVLDDAEQCDDGNLVNGDGCSATCTEEITAGGGGCCGAGRNPSSPIVLGFGVLGLVLRRRRAAGARIRSLAQRL